MAKEGLYTVALKSNNLIHIIDATKGVTVNRTTVKGEIINGPIVVGDRFTVVTKQGNGSMLGLIYKLPAGTIINRFNV
jgi:hypothetical protein